MKTKSLLQDTYALLEKRSVSLQVIAQETSVSYSWINMLNQGRIPDPGVQKVQRVHDFLLSVEKQSAA